MRITQTFILVLAMAALASCAVDTSSDGDQTSSTEQDLSGNQHAAFRYFVARGLTKRQAAGIVGNLIQESSVIPTAREYGGGPGRGIAQWSVGGRWDHSYHDNVVWYAARHSVSRWSLNLQLGFIWYELHSVGGYGLTALRHTTTIRGATLVFERDYEICGACDESRRIAYATQVYNAYAGTAREIGPDDDVTDVDADVATEMQGDDSDAPADDVVDDEPGIE
jgi:hypothetical protein